MDISEAADEDAKFCPHCHTRLDRATDPVLPAEHFENSQRAVVVKGQLRRLTPMLWKLLLIFWERQDKIMPREILLTLLYGDESEPPGKILEVYICQLRGVLRGTPFIIETTRCEGYLFTARRSRKVKPPIEFGAVEDGIPLPPPPGPKIKRPRGTMDHLKRLKPGQSLVIHNSSFSSVQTAVGKAREIGAGTFVAKLIEDGAVRVWRY